VPPRADSSPQNIRKKFPLVLSRINQLVDRIAAQGAGASIDVDQAALRVTLDVIGLVRARSGNRQQGRAQGPGSRAARSSLRTTQQPGC
jgi:cytochrome P450